MSVQEYFRKVAQTVCAQHGINTDEFFSPTRTLALTQARAQFWALTKPYCTRSAAATFLGRHRTSLYHLDEVHEMDSAHCYDYWIKYIAIKNHLKDETPARLCSLCQIPSLLQLQLA